MKLRLPPSSAPQREAAAPRWGDRLQMTPSQQESILKPAGWMHYRYPFIYGQPDTRQFPLATALGGELATRRGARPGVGHRPY